MDKGIRKIKERYGRIEDVGRRFDREFWQSTGDEAIFDAVWEMIVDYTILRGDNADEFRIQRTVESFRKI